MAEFFRKIDRASEIAWWTYWRFNYACAVQPRAAGKMPGIVDVCKGLTGQFLPERVRVVQLSPGQDRSQSSALTTTEVDGLRQLDIEVITVDARRSQLPVEPANTRVLADFFDFS